MSDVQNFPLLALIKERGLADDMQLEEVAQEHVRSGKPISQLLQDQGIMDIETQLHIQAEHLGTEVVSLRDLEIPADVIQTIPAATARVYKCVPVAVYGAMVQVAFADPLNPSAIDELGFAIGKEVQPLVSDPGQIDKAIEKYYPESGESLGDVLKNLGLDTDLGKEVAQVSQRQDIADAAGLADQTPIIRFVNLVLTQAIQDRASDIHFEPFEDEFKIRYRVDGALYEMAPPPKHLALPVTSRIKVMANLDIAERRLPQDGRIALNIAGREVDLRVSTLPTQFGESVVLRVLDREAVKMDIDNLGLPKAVHDYLVENIQLPNGI
ncbi:MAG TPA: ATPase, T2SS/T4P/T4SS family, partial [Candidatus Paceibacterota bacterium]|nr:ATPase, T2SS/T4P/T4SS family [Candidatus Paceibacterota bacterium]